MKTHSAGIIVYRLTDKGPQALIAHMGSPWWAKKDIGAWTIPKGLVEPGEEPFEAAKREFREELGVSAPDGEYLELGSIEQSNNKTVTAWAVQADINASQIQSNSLSIEWPPRSGKTQEFPEIDRAAWLGLAEAAQKTVKGQAELFERLANKLNVPFGAEEIPKATKQGSLF